MPTVISHSVAAIAAGKAFGPREVPKRFWLLSIFCSVLPDADVIGFSFGIPYGHFFGHRGFFHSPFFALLLSLFIVSVFFRTERTFSRRWWIYLVDFSLLSASHGILDAFTNGGRGIALLSPFDETRYFFPWRPILVSPIGITGFISKWGLMTLKSELLWIWLPSLIIITSSWFLRHEQTRKTSLVHNQPS
ncbi:MAG: metal-dependent hydrolase [Syntrophobacterales bacterium]